MNPVSVVARLLPLLALFLAGSPALADDFPRGQIIGQVKTAADSTQSYALYLPNAYPSARPWPVILVFDPGGRGQNGVQRYQAAAEQYGYIVAGSNNSRNGSRDNDSAVLAMANDVLARFNVDKGRVYTAGMSGGSRVALGTALASTGIAGVMASSAGFPDGTPRKSVPFVIFATAGTEDFNHLEMRRLDQLLTTPHHLAIFEGGHTWLSSELAIEAVEWMEIQAVKSGLAPPDPAKVDKIFAKRSRAADAAANDVDRYLALSALAQDFTGLKDVTDATARAASLGKDKDVVTELRRQREEDNHETDLLLGIKALEAKLGATMDERGDALVELRRQWKELSIAAKNPTDSPERRLARRVISLLGSTVETKDPDYLKIISEYRKARGRQ